jgi:sensor domain CHASE-containing protein
MSVSYRRKLMLEIILIFAFGIVVSVIFDQIWKYHRRKDQEMAKTGLYSNIHAKRERIEKQKAEGKPVERMRKVGSKGAPTAAAFKAAAKTAKKK